MKSISPVSKGFGLVVAAVSGLSLVVGVLTGLVWADGYSSNLASHHVYRVGAVHTIGIHSGAADLLVMPGPPGEVTVDTGGFARTMTRELAHSLSSDFTTRVTSEGDRLDVEVHGASFEPVDLLAVGQTRWVAVHVPLAAGIGLLTDAQGGDVELDGLGLTSPSQVSTNGGDVDLNGVSVESAVRVTSSSGNVTFRGRVGSRGSLQVTTGEGNADLTLPAVTDARATVRVNEGNFSADPAWRFSSLPAASGQAFTADLSPSPTGRIDVASTLGNVSFTAS